MMLTLQLVIVSLIPTVIFIKFTCCQIPCKYERGKGQLVYMLHLTSSVMGGKHHVYIHKLHWSACVGLQGRIDHRVQCAMLLHLELTYVNFDVIAP